MHVLARFLENYRQYKDLPNIDLYHYSDMKEDLCGHIQRVAGVPGTPMTDAQWKGKLSDADLAEFDRRIHELLTGEQSVWLVRG